MRIGKESVAITQRSAAPESRRITRAEARVETDRAQGMRSFHTLLPGRSTDREIWREEDLGNRGLGSARGLGSEWKSV